jgi:hypothetical protein
MLIILLHLSKSTRKGLYIYIYIYIYHSYARKFLGRDWRQVLQWRHRPGPLPGSSGQLKAAFALPSAAPSTDFRKTRSRVYICDVWARSSINLVSYEALLVLCFGTMVRLSGWPLTWPDDGRVGFQWFWESSCSGRCHDVKPIFGSETVVVLGSTWPRERSHVPVY